MIAALDPFASLEVRIDSPVRWDEFESQEEWWCFEVERRRRRLARFAAIEDPDQQAYAYELERQLCAADPQHFIEQYVWIQDPHRREPIEMREMPLVMWESQQELVARIEQAFREPKGSVMADLIVIKGRELGVSWTVQACLLHAFIFEPMSSSFCLSQKEKKVDDRTPNSLFGKFRFMIERLPGFLRPKLQRDSHMQLENVNGSTIGGDSTQGSALRGFRGGRIFLDEFPAVEARMQEFVWMSTETVAVGRIVVGTSNGPANLFAKLVNGDRDGVAAHPNLMVMDWRCNPSRTEEWAAAKRDAMGTKQFDQEHGAKIVTLAAGSIWICRKSLVRYGEADKERAFDPTWYRTQPIISGWDFGSGPSLLVCINAIVEHTNSGRFRLWIDSELVWSRTEWVRAAADAVKRVRQYPSRDWTCYGDPSGANPESNLESWETNLRAGGVPMFCLPPQVHADSTAVEWSIRKVQGMIDNDRLRIHDRCQYVWSCIENWSRQAPNGADLDFISRAYIAPKHDIYSHGGKALLYLIEGAMMQDEARSQATAAARQAERSILSDAKMPAQDAIRGVRGLRR